MRDHVSPLKAGLLTYHFSDNYGALFQAYALRRWLVARGIDAAFVNYHPAYVEEGGPFERAWDLRLWRKNATIAYMRLAHLRRQLFGDRAQRRAFAAFRAEHLGVVGPRLLSIDALAPVVRDLDLLICGSDQIWHPSIQRGLDPVYFLDIPGSETARKIAYAPSFGRDGIEPAHVPELGRLVGGLDGVSVREATGLEILARAGVLRHRVSVVPDPTILLGSFADLIGDTPSDGSVFCYALRTDRVIREVATEAAQATGGRLHAPRTPHQRWRDIGEGIVPGPVEWLQSLARAEVVVSNSFHGVALSIVLNRPFIAVALPGKRAGMNARVQNLLSLAGLTDRLACSPDPGTIRQLLGTPVDWRTVNGRLAEIRSEAEAYLDAQIALTRARAA